MKTTIKSLGLILALNLTTHSGIAEEVSLNMQICQTIAANDAKRLRKVVRKTKISLKRVFKDLRCNGEDMLIFSSTANSPIAAKFIMSKIPKSYVEVALPTLRGMSNKEITSLAEDRVK